MRRLAFLAAASLAFIAISEPPSAEAQSNTECKRTCSCSSRDKNCPCEKNMNNFDEKAIKRQRDCKNKCNSSSPITCQEAVDLNSVNPRFDYRPYCSCGEQFSEKAKQDMRRSGLCK